MKLTRITEIPREEIPDISEDMAIISIYAPYAFKNTEGQWCISAGWDEKLNQACPLFKQGSNLYTKLDSGEYCLIKES